MAAACEVSSFHVSPVLYVSPQSCVSDHNRSLRMTWWYPSSNAQVIYWNCYNSIRKFTSICPNVWGFLWQFSMLIARYSLSAAISSYKTSYRKKIPEVFSLGKGNSSCGMWKCPLSFICLGGHMGLSQGDEHLFVYKSPSLLCSLVINIVAVTDCFSCCLFAFRKLSWSIISAFVQREVQGRGAAYLEFNSHLVLNHHSDISRLAAILRQLSSLAKIAQGNSLPVSKRLKRWSNSLQSNIG